ncbi:MAG: hypothetical protein AAF478_05920 [Pseudomonadota bacterium]
MLWEMSTSEWITSLACFSAVAYLSGYFIDRILLNNGFGTIGNWLIILVGIYVGVFSLNKYGYEMHWYPLTTLSSMVAAAALTLMFMCATKRVLNL